MRRSALPAGCEPFDSAQSEPEDLCVETISDVESVRAERARILGVLLARLDVLTETGVAAIRAEIAAYAAQHDPAFLEDLRTQVRLVYRTNLTSMRGRSPSTTSRSSAAPRCVARRWDSHSRTI
jgi:hypothetical protein